MLSLSAKGFWQLASHFHQIRVFALQLRSPKTVRVASRPLLNFHVDIFPLSPLAVLLQLHGPQPAAMCCIVSRELLAADF